LQQKKKHISEKHCENIGGVWKGLLMGFTLELDNSKEKLGRAAIV
jgi:hypothetical protein